MSVTTWLGVTMAVCVAAAATGADGKLRIVKRGGTRQIELSAAAREAINRYNPSFRTWSDGNYLSMIRQFYKYNEHQAPFAVIGDFNADGALDVVLDGRTDTVTVVLALVSTRGGQAFEAIEVTKSEPGSVRQHEESHALGNDVFLRRRVEPGRVTSNFVDEEAVLRGHGFEIEWWEKAAILYYWDKGKGTFKDLVVAD